MYNSVNYITIDEKNEGQRVDNFLLSKLKGVPKSKIYKILRKGEVRVNKGRVKPEYKLCVNDTVRVPPVHTSSTQPPAKVGSRIQSLLNNRICYEDDFLLVVNKPAKMPVHGGTGVSLGVIDAFRQIRPENQFLELAHRLDKDTSGCLVIAKKRAVLRELHELLRQGSMQKHYSVLVHGRWPQDLVKVNLALEKNHCQSGERVVRVSSSGKPSQTNFKIIQEFANHTLIQAKLITGRTHQIRVHCAASGFPIVGDSKYGKADLDRDIAIKRMYLHARYLHFSLESRKLNVTVEADLDDDFKQVLLELEGPTPKIC